MTDDLEELLRRYHPAVPPSSLRARVVASAVDRRRLWPWVAAAAILLGATVALHSARQQVSATWVDGRNQQRESAVEMVAEMLGGGETARRMAEQIVAGDEAIDAMTPTGTAGNDR